MKTLFVVDDNDINLVATETVLSGRYNVFAMPSVVGMFELLKNVSPDLILLDIEMPEMNGFEALRRLKANERYANIPVIFLTGHKDAVIESLGFDMGVVDFITKPFSAPVLLNRIKLHLNIEGLIRERTEKLQRLQNSMVSVLADMVENRDKMTGNHIDRTTMYMSLLLAAMQARGIYDDEVNEWDLEVIISSSRMHDVGKIVISDMILNKPGALTPEEFEMIKTHAAEGERIIEDIIAESGDEDFLRNARLFAGYHHERWDGDGYPRGLAGTEIPLQGRVMAIVDVYDALVSERPYKPAFPHAESVGIIRENRGGHFDPIIADVFLEISDLLAKIGLRR